jgi:hypothetical protein
MYLSQLWAISILIISALEVFADSPSNTRVTASHNSLRAPNYLNKRGLFDLFKSLEGTDRFVDSGKANQWTIPTGVTEYTTAEFYGCTIIILMGEMDVGIGHFREFMPGGDPNRCVLEQASVTRSKLIPDLNKMLVMKDYSCEDARALVISSIDQTSPGARLIREELDNMDIKEARYIKYRGGGGSVDQGPLPGPNGKVVVRTRKTANDVTVEIFLMEDVITARITWNKDGRVTGETWPASAHDFRLS